MKMVILLLAFVLGLCFWALGPGEMQGQILSLLLVMFIGYHLVASYKFNCLALFVMYIFMLSYSLEPTVYYFLHEHIGYRTEVENPYTVYYVALLIYVFFCIYTVFLHYKKQILTPKKSMKGIYSSELIWIICVLATIICIFMGKSGQTIMESGGYRDTMDTLESSSLFGYGIIFLLCSYFYASTKAKYKITLFVTALYILRDLSFGGRIDSLMLCILLFICHFQYVISKKKIMLLVVVGFILNSFFEVYRTLTSGGLSLFVTEGSNIFSLTTGNSGEVYYSSMRIMYLIQNGILDFYSRIESAIYFILSIAVPYSQLPPLANLSSYMQSQYGCGGGGLGPVFIYAMFGIMGVIVFSIWISKCCNYLIQDKRISPYKIYCIYIVAMAPRWYAYYPIAIFKFCVIAMFFFVIIRYMQKNMSLPKNIIKTKKNEIKTHFS